MRLLYRLLEDKHKKILHLLLFSLGEIVIFYAKKKLYLFYISCSFSSLWRQTIFCQTSINSQKLEPQGPACFWSLGAGAAREKKYQEPVPLRKQSGAALKKSGAGAAKKIIRHPSPA